MVENNAPVLWDKLMLENGTINQVQISPPSNFDIRYAEHWPLWKMRFERYLCVANLLAKSEADKINILCYAMGENSEMIIRQIMPNTDNKNLVDVLQAFTDYFGNRINLTSERYRFNSRIQRPDESVDQFITALKELAESCQYGIMKDELIRDRIVFGLSDSRISGKLQLEPHLTLENAISMAHLAGVQCSQDEVCQDSSSPGTTMICTAEENVDKVGETNHTLSNNESADSNTKDEEPSKHINCRDSEDSKKGNDESNSVNCTANRKDQESVEENKKECGVGHHHQIQTFAEEPNKNDSAVVPPVLSMMNDIQLRKTQNALRSFRIKSGDASKEDLLTEGLYETVRGLLNEIRPENFITLVSQVRALKIDSQEKLQGVLDLIFEKAVDEPSFSVAYALMYKELAMMQVSSPGGKVAEAESNINFRIPVLTRCHAEFVRSICYKSARAIKMKEIEVCADPEKKKELQVALMEEDRKNKPGGKMRFMGELFKQGMLSTNIMDKCIRHLLNKMNEESLECLCELLSTIGEDFESENQHLDTYFTQMLNILSGKVSGNVSSRVRSMLQDVIELRMNKWIPRRDDSNPKTMDQIQKELKTERLDTHMNNAPLNTPKKGGDEPIKEGGRSQPVRSRQQYSVETSKLKNNSPPMESLQIGKENMSQLSRNVPADAPKTGTALKRVLPQNISSEKNKRFALPRSESRSTDHKSSDASASMINQ